jgi:hypothetical protein
MPCFRSTSFAAALILVAMPAFAQDSQDHTGHHPGPATAAQPEAGSPAAPPQAGMMGQGMMGCDMATQGMGNPGGMMAGRGMMSMMNMMGTGPTAGHIEGRLAFVKTELKITDGQKSQWNVFADAVRANFKSMTDMRQSMMSQQTAATTLPERLAFEDKAMTAHLAGLKKVENTLDKLYSVLTEDQKKIADGIVVGPMGMPMGMM